MSTVLLDQRKPAAGSLEKRTVTLSEAEMRSAPKGPGTFRGYAAVFDTWSEDMGFREKIQRGAFRKVLSKDPDVRFLLNHNPDFVFGRTRSGTLRLEEDTKGLAVEADLPDTEPARTLATLVERRDIDAMSFHFFVYPDGRDEWDDTGSELRRTIHEFGDLLDVCCATYPAYPDANGAGVRSLRIGGVQVTDERGDPLPNVIDTAWKIHRGEVPASAEERARLDDVLAKLDTVSPWLAQRAFRAASQEPELQGVIPGKRVTIEDVDGHEGEPAYELAARERRLRLLNHDLGVEQ